MKDLEMIAMDLVGNAGIGKSLAFEALFLAKKGDFEGAREKLKLSNESILKAHHTQTELICEEADGNKVEMGLLMVHAQDHLMTSILARELITELVEVYEKLNTK